MQYPTPNPREWSTLRGLDLERATIPDLQRAMGAASLTSKDLVAFYLERIQRVDPLLRSTISVDPHALRDAERG